MSEEPHQHRVPTVLETDKAIDEAARLFAAAGDPARLRLLELLSRGEYCVGGIAEATGEAMSTISQRLRILHQVGLLSRRRDGRHIYYRLADDHVVELIANALAHVKHK
ncbi:MAG: helix-turn-helix transcriptional regulator [Proteobacteria bacterium]|jgi:ArsR family transcriptional regulator, lead/cadmium/zinc/bismuth-responsive transcriptional repressor|nr:helix-turn-helix transcriptional regulator [Pseudomonadota bacterium]